MFIKNDSVLYKIWSFLQSRLTLNQFDLCVQGSLFLIILLETNVYLLLERDAKDGHLPALIRDWVKISAAGVEFILGAGLAWYGSNHKRLNLACWMAATSVISCLVLAFPYAVSTTVEVELCGGSPISNYADITIVDDNVTGRVAILTMTAIMCCLMKVSIFAHGLTFLDDHAPEKGAYFYGILISISLTLALSGSSWLSPGSRRQDWWVAHLSLSMLTALFAVFFLMFPKTMPGYKELGDSNEDTGFVASLTRMVHNRRLVLQTIGIAFMNVACFGFLYYDKPYVQGRFHLEAYRNDPRASRGATGIFRSLFIVSFVMIFRIRFSERRPDSVKANTAARVATVLAIFVIICFTILSIMGCSLKPIAGLETAVFEPQTCSENCGCNANTGFMPVCALDSQKTFFSPCDAGCRTYEDLGGLYVFHNCTCGSERAVRGSCSLLSCLTSFNVFQVLYTLILAISGASLLLQGMAVLRCVRPKDKPIAMGVVYAVSALLSYVLGHALYMGISYVTCAHWWGGACALHAPGVWALAASSALCAALSALCSRAVSKMPARAHQATTQL